VRDANTLCRRRAGRLKLTSAAEPLQHLSSAAFDACKWDRESKELTFLAPERIPRLCFLFLNESKKAEKGVLISN